MLIKVDIIMGMGMGLRHLTLLVQHHGDLSAISVVLEKRGLLFLLILKFDA